MRAPLFFFFFSRGVYIALPRLCRPWGRKEERASSGPTQQEPSPHKPPAISVLLFLKTALCRVCRQYARREGQPRSWSLCTFPAICIAYTDLMGPISPSAMGGLQSRYVARFCRRAHPSTMTHLQYLNSSESIGYDRP